jgi:hypothetical protein
MAHLWLLFKNIGYQEENYNFWDFFTTICDIKCIIYSINSIRNLRPNFADNRSKNNIYQNQASRGTNAGANFIQSRHFMSHIVVKKSFHVFTAHGVHFPVIFRACVKKFYLSGQIIVDLWFKVNPEVFPLLKPHYVYTAWLHKISPTLIVRRICSINSIRNLRHGVANLCIVLP